MRSILKWLPLGSAEEITSSELSQLLGDPTIQIVDVRFESEFEQSRIAGARNLPITRFTRDAIEALQLDPDLQTVCICLSAHRSIPAVRQLESLGFSRVVQLAGGMKAWWAGDHPCVGSS